MNQSTLSDLRIISLIAVIVFSCASTSQTHLKIDTLKNAEYKSEWASDGIAKLINGIYKEKIVPNAASELIIILSEHYAFGDINGDTDEDAAVVLISHSGGSGTFYYLSVVINQNGTPVNVATEFLGDRVKIRSFTIKSGEIVVEMVTQAPGDPMFRPSLSVTQKYKLHGNKLIRTD